MLQIITKNIVGRSAHNTSIWQIQTLFPNPSAMGEKPIETPAKKINTIE